MLGEPSYLVLAALLEGPLHGYGLIQRIEVLSGARRRMAVGTLYGVLDRLLDRGLIVESGEEVVGGKVRRYYALTEPGREAVAEATEARRAQVQKVLRLLEVRPT